MKAFSNMVFHKNPKHVNSIFLSMTPIEQPPRNSPSPSANSSPPMRSPNRKGFDFRHFWHSLVEKIWIVALCVLGGLVIALVYLARTPKLYQGHVVLEVDVQDPSPIRSEDPPMRSAMFLASQDALRTIEQNITNRSLISRVVRAEGLADDGGRALLGSWRPVENRRSKKSRRNRACPRRKLVAVPSAKISLTGQMIFTPLEDALGGALSHMVKPVIRRGTRLIDVYVTNRDPALAQRLADAVGREYIR